MQHVYYQFSIRFIINFHQAGNARRIVEAHSQAAAGRFLPATGFIVICLLFECFYLLRFPRDFNRLLVILPSIMIYCDVTIL